MTDFDLHTSDHIDPDEHHHLPVDDRPGVSDHVDLGPRHDISSVAPVVHEYDYNHDGRVDAVSVDTDHDGKDDVWQYDLDNDGVIDMTGYDVNHDG